MGIYVRREISRYTIPVLTASQSQVMSLPKMSSACSVDLLIPGAFVAFIYCRSHMGLLDVCDVM